MLSVHGPRGDGFHALTSLVVALEFGDSLVTSLSEANVDQLYCEESRVPLGPENLILKAAEVYRQRTGVRTHFTFKLEKRIPMGAGLGGGSSNAAVALRAMNRLTDGALSNGELSALAAELGSDCPFFIDAVPALMSGRGEVLDPISVSQAKRLKGQRLLLFRPDFPIHTGWAYRQLIESSPSAYESEPKALARLENFWDGGDFSDLLYNTFEEVVGGKYLAIPSLLEQIRSAGYDCLMSGSGSCCFALPRNEEESAAIREMCFDAWGAEIFFVETLTQ